MAEKQEWSVIKRRRIPCVSFSDVIVDHTNPQGNPCKCPAKKLYACDRHQRCARTAEGVREGVPCCDNCEDYVPDLPELSQPTREAGLKEASNPIDDQAPEITEAPIMSTFDGEIHTRHLAYVVMPVSRNGVWQRNLDNLRLRMPLFNGRKVVAIMDKGDSDHHVDTPEAVKEHLRGYDCEFVEIPNQKALREVKAFRPLFDLLHERSGTESGHATFFAHAKGVTRPYNVGVTVHPWTDILYHTLLDYWPLVEQVLKVHPLAGSFKKVGRGFQGSRSSWHYSGSFLWFRNDAVFSKADWARIDRQWWGTESWPGIHWPKEQAGCIFHEAPQNTLNLYDMGYLRKIVLPELQQWCQRHSASRIATG